MYMRIYISSGNIYVVYIYVVYVCVRACVYVRVRVCVCVSLYFTRITNVYLMYIGKNTRLISYYNNIYLHYKKQQGRFT